MKDKIHPKYHMITVEKVDGSTFETRSTWAKEGSVLKLEVDPSVHPAWTGENRMLARGDRVSRFNKKFSAFLGK